MAKIMTKRNAIAVMGRLTEMVVNDEETSGDLIDALNEMLDGLLEQDVFGTEGQKDPRGDARG